MSKKNKKKSIKTKKINIMQAVDYSMALQQYNLNMNNFTVSSSNFY